MNDHPTTTESEVFIMMEVAQVMRRLDVPVSQAIEILEKMAKMWKEELKSD